MAIYLHETVEATYGKAEDCRAGAGSLDGSMPDQ